MKVSLYKPSFTSLKTFLQRQAMAQYSYAPMNGTQNQPVKGFDNDYSSIVLGRGETIWKSAQKALLNWHQFPEPWTEILPEQANLQSGEVVAVLFRIFGIWWINSARIVYAFDEEQRFGFAYGTLPGHIERGEECFWIERDENDQVSYHIRAFSQPAYWFVWLAYPLARFYQRRFVKESLKRMKNLSNE